MSTLNTQILEQASEWLVEFETGEPDAGARREFDAWLRQSPDHVRAYLELLPLWKQGATTQFARDTGPEALIAYARSEDNVVSLKDRHAGERSSAAPEQIVPVGAAASEFPVRHRRAVLAAAAAVAAIAVMVVWRTVAGGTTYSTGIGEQHSAVLADGSTLELNAMSKVRTRFSARRRTVELIEGQALFRVAADPARPFVVEAGGTQVRAVGTQFDVYRKKSGTVVTVVEGRVAVSLPASVHKGEGPAGVALLCAGEQITLRESSARPVAHSRTANIGAATAWTQRRLVFDASSLSEVVQEFNRYNTRQIVLADTALDTFPITGTFSSTSPASLIRFLQAQPGIRVTAEDNQIRISSAGPE